MTISDAGAQATGPMKDNWITTAYKGYAIQTRWLTNGTWTARLASSDGSAKARATSFRTQADAIQWATKRIDGLVSLGIVPAATVGRMGRGTT